MTKTFKKHILISSIALAFATLQSAQAAPSANYEESLNSTNPELKTDITAKDTKDAVEISGPGTNYEIIGKQVTANKNSSAIALSISGGSTSTASGEVSVNATDSTFKATTTKNDGTSWAKALNISLPNHDNPLTIKGGTFIAEGAGGTSRSAAVYMKAAVDDKQHDVTFDGAAFEAAGGLVNYSFYIVRNKSRVSEDITLNNSDIRSGDIYSSAETAEDHVVKFTLSNTQVGSTEKIAITAHAQGVTNDQGSSDENFTLNADNKSSINADVLALATFSGDTVEFNLNLNGGSTLAGNISTKGGTGARANADFCELRLT